MTRHKGTAMTAPAPTTDLTIERPMNFASPRRQRPSRRSTDATRSTPAARTPRVARLLALAYRIDELVQRGHAADYATVANVGGVTRARVSQIVALLNLAPDIQEAILALPPEACGNGGISEHDLRPIAAELDWRKQRRMWGALRRDRNF